MKSIRTITIISGVILAIPVLLIVGFFVWYSYSPVSEEKAGELAQAFIQEKYHESVTIDKVFMHGGYLAYEVTGHLHDSYQTVFRVLVDNRSGEVDPFEFPRSYTNSKMYNLHDKYKEELLAQNFQAPDRIDYSSGSGSSFFGAYGCAHREDCMVQELRVAIPSKNPADMEQAFRTLYEWQKKVPERIDSIMVEVPMTKEEEEKAVPGSNRYHKCLRPDSTPSDRSTRYTLDEFLRQGECESVGDY
ncbi:PepSY domain-containing protein [Paenibacillus tuaregi]|uniref:PepSY domain-containing protein n=1 Tax=Paenibacillus tuaregi TaxID=1816681 RepID=UPI000838AD62|nr:PepSY domain-containing protein [Paenibacillus tuaregi]